MSISETRSSDATANGNAIDMLHGPIWNRALLFALPVAATGVLEQLFNATGVAIVGNFSGANDTQAVAAVGANSFIVMLVVNFFIGISLGANVVIANAVGRGSSDAVSKAVHTELPDGGVRRSTRARHRLAAGVSAVA